MIWLSKLQGDGIGLFHPTVQMSEKKVEAKEHARGRKPRDPILKLRTLLWYWGVRYKTGKKNGELDLLYRPDEEEHAAVAFGMDYTERTKRFEEIERNGGSLSIGTHPSRSFDLLKLVENHKKHPLKGSANLYNSPFWEYLIEAQPSIESSMFHIQKMIEVLELKDARYKDISNPQLHELEEIARRTGWPIEAIMQSYAVDIHSEGRKIFDNIFHSFGSSGNYTQLWKDLDFALLTRYLNNLSLFVALYRYAMLTGNFHALIAVADCIKDMLDIFKAPPVIHWLPSDRFRLYFVDSIYNKIFKPNYTLHKLFDIPVLENTAWNNNNLALNVFLRTINGIRIKYRMV